ncbi:hypothetical protein K2173_005849 [Erythroxylum novogranatense]|uniref:Uncharacterized protein n=1 Tax=Erythroxylum novogranatense TaxID=1862640 RepID=A0AAV8U5L6_9ROSI|nr:hypothetical protein K2173_005849 [Erythroxylum novogranatense]
MEGGNFLSKEMKLEIPQETDHQLSSGGTKFQVTSPLGTGLPTLTRQPSATKNTCLCSPTNHVGSFRCRLHRAPNLQRTKSIDSGVLQDSSVKDDKATTDGDAIANSKTAEGN